ncbi:hypothetical protein JS530_09780 [Bifidobacterium sp. LC6]|uniref:Glycosyltransferase RgtA/B/C/D-like domain-containing protein n=1 Tax=Bifidobacterium colobi TaxID=2809026 RepID=A0ABS5UYR6_9BIFI|nr:hypothetical protein [Bifidobacterium colobi]MBT1175781.1 hypothetical protein [Bifidobacterium colobi]
MSIFTTYDNPDQYNHLFISIISALIAGIFCIVILRWKLFNVWIDSAPLTLCYIVFLSTIFLLSLLWICLANGDPTSDQLMMFKQADGMRNRLLSLDEQIYITRYPYQSGYVLFIYIMGGLFGAHHYLVIRLFNAIATLLLAFALCRASKVLSNDENTEKRCMLVVTAFLPLTCFAPFIYGNIPSTAFAVMACVHQLKISVDCKKLSSVVVYNVAAMFLWYFLAIWFRPTSIIFVIASILVALTIAIIKRNIAHVAVAGACIIAYLLAAMLPAMIVRTYTGYPDDSSRAMPKAAFIAMGLQDTAIVPGWYNEYTGVIYDQAGGDSDRTAELAIQSIKERVAVFAHHPRYAAGFFIKKIGAMWSEPTFYSLQSSIIPDDESAGRLQHLLNRTSARNVYLTICDIVQSAIYLLAFIGLFVKRRSITLQQMLFFIIALGGFLYLSVWETKSNYAMPFFLVLIPYAAVAWTMLTISGAKQTNKDHSSSGEAYKI